MALRQEAASWSDWLDEQQADRLSRRRPFLEEELDQPEPLLVNDPEEWEPLKRSRVALQRWLLDELELFDRPALSRPVPRHWALTSVSTNENAELLLNDLRAEKLARTRSEVSSLRRLLRRHPHPAARDALQRLYSEGHTASQLLEYSRIRSRVARVLSEYPLDLICGANAKHKSYLPSWKIAIFCYENNLIELYELRLFLRSRVHAYMEKPGLKREYRRSFSLYLAWCLRYPSIPDALGQSARPPLRNDTPGNRVRAHLQTVWARWTTLSRAEFLENIRGSYSPSVPALPPAAPLYEFSHPRRFLPDDYEGAQELTEVLLLAFVRFALSEAPIELDWAVQRYVAALPGFDPEFPWEMAFAACLKSHPLVQLHGETLWSPEQKPRTWGGYRAGAPGRGRGLRQVPLRELANAYHALKRRHRQDDEKKLEARLVHLFHGKRPQSKSSDRIDDAIRAYR